MVCTFLQEAFDAQIKAAKLPHLKPRQYKDRLFMELENLIDARFAPLLEAAGRCGVPNTKVRL